MTKKVAAVSKKESPRGLPGTFLLAEYVGLPDLDTVGGSEEELATLTIELIARLCWLFDKMSQGGFHDVPGIDDAVDVATLNGSQRLADIVVRDGQDLIVVIDFDARVFATGIWLHDQELCDQEVGI